MKNGRIIMKSVFVLILTVFSFQVMAQSKTITGKVTDSENLPLPGVTIIEKGTANGTVTDANGNYKITISNPNDTLIFKSIGMVTEEIGVNNQTNINMSLVGDIVSLSEVVVVGYGTQKKANLSGAVTAIEGEAITKKASSDVLSAMQGELPGVMVLRSSGQPGAESSGIRIRGFSSANTTKALVLVDGVEGDIALLNPNDIESISVLKDAGSAAIYGARAAAGVVLVTTKKGNTSGKVTVNYNGYYAINLPGNMPERVPAWEEQDMINIGRVAAGGSPEWNAEQSSWVNSPNFNYRPNNTNGRWDYFQATNWVEEGTKDYTVQQNHSVSINGGTEKMNYLASAGYFTKDGLLKFGPDGYNRYNARLKINSEVNKYVSFGAQFSYAGSFTETNPYGVTNVLERLYRIRGRQPIFAPEEDINVNPYNGDLQVNPIDLMKNGGISKNNYEAYTGKGELTIKNIIPGFRANLSASRQSGNYNSDVERRNLIWYDRLGTTVRFQANNPNSLTKTKNFDKHDNLEAIVNYDRKLGKHSLGLLAGTTYEIYRKDQFAGTANNLNSNDFFTFNYYDASIATNTSLSDSIATWAMNSYFGRLNYDYDERYLLEANVRYDGSSRLSPENRWKMFPSFSAAWRLTKEKWFDFDFISNLKFRGSWGQLGNGAVLGLYDYLATISNGTNIGESYYYQTALASHSKTWETIETTNIGFDFGLLKNRLSFTGDYYWKYNKNMLATLQLPNLVGIPVPNANVGELKTWGWEIEMKWQDKIGKLSYQTSLNVSDNQNKLIHYDGKNTISPGTVNLLEGYELNSIWGYKTAGYWNSREEYLQYKTDNPGYETFNDAKIAGGDVRYVAKGKADHMIGAGGGTPDNPGDLVYLGNTNGRYSFGFNLAAQWKGFDFSIFFQGIGQRKFLIATETIAPFYSTSTMPWTIHRDYWTEENKDAYWPRMYNNNGNDFNFKPSDKWIQNGAYIRLKNIQLGYKIPIPKRFVERARIYISGADVWEHSHVLSVFDPEVGNNASAQFYPFFRTWTLGLDVTF